MLVAFAALCLAAQVYAANIHSPTEVQTLSTKFVQVQIDRAQGQITNIAANFEGLGDFGKNVLSSPFRLEPVYFDSKHKQHPPLTKRIAFKESSDANSVMFSVEHSLSEGAAPVIIEEWTVSVEQNLRSLKVNVSGLYSGGVDGLQALVYGLYTHNPSITAFTSAGTVQMMNQEYACLGLDAELQRAYALGAGSAIDVTIKSAGNATSSSRSTVLLSARNVEEVGFASGIQHVVAGEFPHISREMTVAWTGFCWQSFHSVAPLKATSWSSEFVLVPNDHNFPALQLADTRDTPSWPLNDLEAYLLGIYGSAAGCLQSYYANQQGIVAPTIAHPDAGYSPDTNFFDPDNFLTMNALLYSNDAYLQNEVKQVLWRTAQTMCGIGSNADPKYCDQNRQNHVSRNMALRMHNRLRKGTHSGAHPASNQSSRAGQLMHHFISLQPTYESIAGSEQLGPNIFWTLTAVRYLAWTGDSSFLDQLRPFLELSLDFVMSFIDTDEDGRPVLVLAPGPLWIDVLVREYYASDSNAMMVHFLKEMTTFFAAVDAVAYAALLQEMQAAQTAIVTNMNARLWSDDHYVTQQNLDGTTRDFVDYDSNLLAVAFGIASQQQSSQILARIDSNPVAHVRATWCSEIPYSGDAQDCYIVGGSVCGDSVVTLARIGYADAWARKRVNDVHTLKSVLLQPLQQDLLRDVWLYERYDADGQQIRTAYYFEYPSLVSMILRELVYGVVMDVDALVLDPLEEMQEYIFGLGNLRVEYSQKRVLVRLAMLGEAFQKTVRIEKLLPNAVYVVQQGAEQRTVHTNEVGGLSFAAQASALRQGIVVSLSAQK